MGRSIAHFKAVRPLSIMLGLGLEVDWVGVQLQYGFQHVCAYLLCQLANHILQASCVVTEAVLETAGVSLGQGYRLWWFASSAGMSRD